MYLYSNLGNSFRCVAEDIAVGEGEVLFEAPASPEELDGAFPGRAADQLAAVKAAKVRALTASCEAAILEGYTSDALGTPHLYPANLTDQINMLSSVADAGLEHEEGWTTPFTCRDGEGSWDWRNHTASQIQQAGADGKAAITAIRAHLKELRDQVAAAADAGAVAEIAW